MGIRGRLKARISFDQFLKEWTPKKLAKKLKVSERTVYMWKEARCFPSIHHIKMIHVLSEGAVSYEEIIDRPIRRGGK